MEEKILCQEIDCPYYNEDAVECKCPKDIDKPCAEKAPSELSMGTLYDMNKSIINQIPALSKTKLQELIKEIGYDFWHRDNKYYMLLCRECNDYTIFRFSEKTLETAEVFNTDFYECLTNRGETISIERKDGGAYEIWIRFNNESYCYYLFEYDMGVLEY